MTTGTREFLGIGWKFPLQVTPAGKIAQSRYEQRIEELIAQCSGIPPGEVMQLLLTADRNQDIDLEKELHALREKYNDIK